MNDLEEGKMSNPKARGLGRGLSALFEDDEVVYPQADPEGQTPGRVRQMLGLDQMMPFRGQARRMFKESALYELADSIKKHGVLQPLLVRENPDQGGMYEIIAGERRWRAAQIAQVHELPVIFLTVTDSQAFEIALIENLQREDLGPIEEAMGFQRLIADYAYTQEQLAEALGKSRSHIANMMRLTQLPEAVQKFLSDGDLSVGHARALITVEDPEELAKEIMSKGLSVRQTEHLITRLKKEQDTAENGALEDILRSKRDSRLPPVPEGKDVNTRALEDHVSNILGMRVHIDNEGKGKGVLRIEYSSFDQLDEVLHRLSHNPGSRLNG